MPANSKVDSNTASFTIPAVLAHRVCSNLFSLVEASDKYDRVAEMQGIWVNLDEFSRTGKQYVRKGLIYKIENNIAGWTDPHLECWTKNEVCKLE
uniref:Cystatin domain-containing protein n=1 Tax=Meloidogyne hapla TaxID=6305 RepID=A0A1I8BAN1_MELHA